MRNWTVAVITIITITLPAGSVWSKTIDAKYKSIREVCLFSPTLTPANSPLAIQSMGEEIFDASDYSDDLMRDFEKGFAAPTSTTSIGLVGAPAIATQTISLKGIYDLRWRSDINGKYGIIPNGIDSDETELEFRGGLGKAEYGRAEYLRPKFRLSGVSGVGVERNNGFVAGFDLKY
jgi:hypothetical protein